MASFRQVLASTSLFAIVSATIASPTHATIIVDPDSVGATNVFPQPITTITNPAFERNLVIGNGLPGTVRLDASNAGNGITNITVDRLGIREAGDLRILGDGSPVSASLTVENDPTNSILNGGFLARGQLSLQSGAQLNASGLQAVGHVNQAIVIDGSNTQLSLSGLSQADRGGASGFDVNGAHFADGNITLGDSGLGRTGTVDFSITNGATVSVSSGTNNAAFLPPALRIGANTSFTVDGTGSIFEFDNSNIDLNWLETPGTAPSTINVTNGGQILQTGAPFPVASVASFNLVGGDVNASGVDSLVSFEGGGRLINDSALTVTDTAEFVSRGDIRVGLRSDSTGTVTVANGGRIEANTITLFEGGLLTGNGGTIDASVINNGGVVAPGASPGIMTINGDFAFEMGTLELEYESPSVFDRLIVNGEVTFLADAMIEISLGALPLGDLALEDFITANAFNVLGGFDPLDNIQISFTNSAGVSDGDAFDFDFLGDVSRFVVGQGFTRPNVTVSEPATIALLGFALSGLVVTRRRLV